MKKLWLVSALSLGAVLLAGCVTTSKPVTITSSDDMINLYNESKAMTCTLEATAEWESAVSTMYFKDWMISQTSKVVSEWEEYNDHALARDGMMYGWGDSYGDAGMYMEYEINVEEELGWFGELEEWTTLTCVKWVSDNSVFDLPSDIEFTSLNDLFWGDEYYDEEYSEEYNEENLEENIEEEVVEENVEEEVVEEVEEVVE